MAGLRKAASYSKHKARPFTRVARSKKKAFIKVIPGNKVTKFDSGSLSDYRSGKHKFRLRVVSEQKAQVRDNALEAVRAYVTKILETEMPGQYFFEIKVHPHHLIRENKAAGAVAGADRLSQGMRHSFGVVIGRAAIVHDGTDILNFSCIDEKDVRVARKAFEAIKSKLPCKAKIVFEKLG